MGKGMQSGFGPGSVRIWGEFEDRAIDAIGVGGIVIALKIAGSVEKESGLGISAILFASEVVQDGVGPRSAGSGREFKNHAILVAATVLRGAVKVSGGVDHERRNWVNAIRSGETVNHGFAPSAAGGRHEFKNRAYAVQAARDGGAVEIAGSVENQSCLRTVSVRNAHEAVDDRFSPGAVRVRRHFEDAAIANGSALPGGAVDISG